MDTCAEEWLDEEYRNFVDESTNESTSSFIDSSEVAESVNNQVSPVISSCIPSTIPERTDRALNRIRSKTPLSTNIPRPSSSISPSPTIQTTKKRKLDSETVYAGAIEAHSISNP